MRRKEATVYAHAFVCSIASVGAGTIHDDRSAASDVLKSITAYPFRIRYQTYSLTARE